MATNIQISLDPQTIAFVRRSMDIMRDTTRSKIWLVSTAGDEHKPALSGLDSYSSPRWSPDGNRLNQDDSTGYGIGLSNVRTLVQAAGGSTDVKSEAKGTSFKIQLTQV